MKVRLPKYIPEKMDSSQEEVGDLEFLIEDDDGGEDKKPSKKVSKFVTVDFSRIESWDDDGSITILTMASGRTIALDLAEEIFANLYVKIAKETIDTVEYFKYEENEEDEGDEFD